MLFFVGIFESQIKLGLSFHIWQVDRLWKMTSSLQILPTSLQENERLRWFLSCLYHKSVFKSIQTSQEVICILHQIKVPACSLSEVLPKSFSNSHRPIFYELQNDSSILLLFRQNLPCLYQNYRIGYTRKMIFHTIQLFFILDIL